MVEERKLVPAIMNTGEITADERQPWTNYENNGNEYLIIGTVVRSEYSNIRYKHLIIGNV